MSGDDELAGLLVDVRTARADKAVAQRRSHLAYCATVARVVALEVRERGKRGARARSARHLEMSRANVGQLLADLAAASSEPVRGDRWPVVILCRHDVVHSFSDQVALDAFRAEHLRGQCGTCPAAR
jgi:hypothetical protein